MRSTRRDLLSVSGGRPGEQTEVLIKKMPATLIIFETLEASLVRADSSLRSKIGA